MIDQALERASAGREQAEADLFEFLAIPSVSALPAHDADTRRACEWTAERLRRMGMAVEVAEGAGGRHPGISAEWLGRPGQPTLALYGPYDAQPPDPPQGGAAPPLPPARPRGP